MATNQKAIQKGSGKKSSRAIMKSAEPGPLGAKVETPLVMDLSHAVAAMMNSRTTVSEESKGGALKVSFAYPAELVALLRGAFPSGRAYKFQLHYNSPFAASVAGVINLFVAWSPSVSSYSEWSALAALFDEVKIRNSKLIWTARLGWGLTAALPAQIAMAPDNVTNGAASSGFTAVQRLAESKLFSSNVPQVNGGATVTFMHKVPDRPYASTTTPAITSPPSGCTGQWSFASASAGTNSFIYADYAMTNVFEFRSRA